ncbi:MAG: hypothetical protein QNJ20_16770 [Paracoccaceae bacterium]|nr:hypothetical protein [Paracoccaceae bacterium]
MTLSRRDAAKLILSGTLLSAVPLPVNATSSQDWAALLEDALNATAVPGVDAVFDVVFFEKIEAANEVAMIAIVELTWKPGFRRRRFDAAAPTEDLAFIELGLRAGKEFGEAGIIA